MGIIKSKPANKNSRKGWEKTFKKKQGKKHAGQPGVAKQKIGPELLPEHMRKLPSDFVTKDTAEGHKVHELDPPHVAGALVDDLIEEKTTTKTVTQKEHIKNGANPGATKEYQPIPITQELVDYVRMNIINALLESALSSKNYDWAFKPRYVWFPNNDIGTRQLREGNPPPNCDRPKHLKNIRLHLDPLNIPRSIKDKLQSLGLSIPTAEAAIDLTIAKERFRI